MARSSTYVVFDGDNDGWAYQYIVGWGKNKNLDFVFKNSHDIDTMTSQAQDEAYVKRNLKARMAGSTEVMLLIGEKTKHLYRYVRWELDLALEHGLPIIAVNLNKMRTVDDDRLPPILRGECVLHIAYRYRAIKHALNIWPAMFRGLNATERAKGARIFTATTYSDLGLDE